MNVCDFYYQEKEKSKWNIALRVHFVGVGLNCHRRKEKTPGGTQNRVYIFSFENTD